MIDFGGADKQGARPERTESTNGANAVGQRVLGSKSRRAIYTPALGALALVGGLAAGIGSFTSQESSNLVWGGFKYLENYELPLVFELSRSRNRLMKAYPDNIKEVA